MLDQRDITSSLAIEVAQCHFHSSLTPAYGVGYKHPLQYDVKSHPPDKVELDSPHLSVSSVLPKGPFSVDKAAQVQSMNSPHNLCPRLYTDENQEYLLHVGDKAIGNESTHQPMVSPLVNQGPSDEGPTNAWSCVSTGCAD